MSNRPLCPETPSWRDDRALEDDFDNQLYRHQLRLERQRAEALCGGVCHDFTVQVAPTKQDGTTAVWDFSKPL